MWISSLLSVGNTVKKNRMIQKLKKTLKDGKKNKEIGSRKLTGAHFNLICI